MSSISSPLFTTTMTTSSMVIQAILHCKDSSDSETLFDDESLSQLEGEYHQTPQLVEEEEEDVEDNDNNNLSLFFPPTLTPSQSSSSLPTSSTITTTSSSNPPVFFPPQKKTLSIHDFYNVNEELLQLESELFHELSEYGTDEWTSMSMIDDPNMMNEWFSNHTSVGDKHGDGSMNNINGRYQIVKTNHNTIKITCENTYTSLVVLEVIYISIGFKTTEEKKISKGRYATIELPHHTTRMLYRIRTLQ
jgi:hypothetical protein